MKKVILSVLLCFLVSVSANAALVTNGGFDEDAAEWGSDGGTGGGTASWGNSHEPTGGNPGGYVTLREDPGTSWAWGVWYQIGLEDLDVWGIPAGTTVTMSADVKAETETSAVDHAYLKIEAWSTGVLNALEVQLPPVTTDWENYSIDFTPNALATGLKCVLVAKDAASAAEIGFDNVAIGIPGGTPALFPIPTVGGNLYQGTPVLSWTNPDPNNPDNPANAIKADVYILETDALLTERDPNLGPFEVDDDVVQVANDITEQSLDLSDLSGAGVPISNYTLTAGKYYYWAVHVTDPNDGGSVVIPGFDWYFLATGDVPPTANAGDDRYLVTEGSGMELQLDAIVTDDGTPAISWADLTADADKNPNTTVEFDPNQFVEDPIVRLTNTVDDDVRGYYVFEITVDDGFNDPVTDQVDIVVYATCAEAAEGDPGDTWDTTGDLNGDCKKDINDFVIFARGWLDCNDNRILCP